MTSVVKGRRKLHLWHLSALVAVVGVVVAAAIQAPLWLAFMIFWVFPSVMAVKAWYRHLKRSHDADPASMTLVHAILVRVSWCSFFLFFFYVIAVPGLALAIVYTGLD